MRLLLLTVVLAGLLSGTRAAAQFDFVALADAEGDGVISRDEFTAYYALVWLVFAEGKSKVDVEHAPPFLRAMILSVLPKSKGVVGRDQMLDAVPKRYPDADKNKDSIVTLAELREWQATAIGAPPH